MADGKPIIVIKKKGGHGGHHGGAWKIAYADFVTAMMCFFMVMWLVNTADVVTKENIASYFRRPGIFDTGSGTPLMMGQSGILEEAFSPSTKFKAGTQGGKNDTEEGGGKGEEAGKLSTLGGEEDPGLGAGQGGDKDTNVVQEVVGPEGEQNSDQEFQIEPSDGQVQQFEQTAQEIKTLVAGSPELQDLLGVVDVKLEADGLNIEIVDTEKTSMFMVGSARVLPDAEAAFSKLAKIIAKLNNTVDIVGHTDSRRYPQEDRGYSNWDLSADRANSARRILQAQGFESKQINSVVGMADRLLRKSENSLDATNRRISLKVRFNATSSTELSSEEIKERLSNPNLSKKSLSGNKISQTQSIPVKPQPTPPPPEPAHIFTPKEIIHAARKQHKDRIILPKDRVPGVPYVPSKKDKIFNDIPVIAPGDPFGF